MMGLELDALCVCLFNSVLAFRVRVAKKNCCSGLDTYLPVPTDRVVPGAMNDVFISQTVNKDPASAFCTFANFIMQIKNRLLPKHCFSYLTLDTICNG